MNQTKLSLSRLQGQDHCRVAWGPIGCMFQWDAVEANSDGNSQAIGITSSSGIRTAMVNL